MTIWQRFSSRVRTNSILSQPVFYLRLEISSLILNRNAAGKVCFEGEWDGTDTPKTLVRTLFEQGHAVLFGGTDFRPGQISGWRRPPPTFLQRLRPHLRSTEPSVPASRILATVSKVCSSVILDLHVIRVLESVRLDSAGQSVPLLVWLTDPSSLRHLLPAAVISKRSIRLWSQVDTYGHAWHFAANLDSPFHSPPNLAGTLVNQNDPPLDLEVGQSANIKDHMEQLVEAFLLSFNVLQGLIGGRVRISLCVFSVVPGQSLSPRSFIN